ncbi:MAG: hypothetical protein ACKVU1_07315 [bacterium]
MGQLVGLARGEAPRPERSRLRLRPVATTDLANPLVLELRLNLKFILFRWVQGFHAALYREFLPWDTLRAIHPPAQPGIETPTGVVFDPLLPQIPKFVEIIKQGRIAGRLDAVRCGRGTMNYECVWRTADNGEWACVFALDFYEWKTLGSTQLPQNSCVGFYQPGSGLPSSASVVPAIEVPFTNFSPLDAFAP